MTLQEFSHQGVNKKDAWHHLIPGEKYNSVNINVAYYIM